MSKLTKKMIEILIEEIEDYDFENMKHKSKIAFKKEHARLSKMLERDTSEHVLKMVLDCMNNKLKRATGTCTYPLSHYYFLKEEAVQRLKQEKD